MGLIEDRLDGVQAIIFDCDGTLVDSAPLYATAWAAGLATSGKPMERDWYMARSGLSEHVFMDEFEAEANVCLDRQFVVRVVRETFLRGIENLREIAGVGLIARMAKPLLPLAVASGGPMAIVQPSLQQAGLLNLFNAVVTIEDVAHPKPAPDLFLEAARRLDVLPSACLVIEDSPTGLAAAEAAGMAGLSVHDASTLASLQRRLHSFAEWEG